MMMRRRGWRRKEKTKKCLTAGLLGYLVDDFSTKLVARLTLGARVMRVVDDGRAVALVGGF